MITDKTPKPTESQIWLTHYHLSPQDTPSSTRTAYLLCLAHNVDDYNQQIAIYLTKQRLNGQAQLAPLPIQTWLTRHGFEAKLWRVAQQISNENPLICLYTQDETENTERHIESYINQQSVQFSPFTALVVQDAIPQEVRSLFFSDFDGLGEYHKILSQNEHKREREKQALSTPHFYAVVDCAKAVSFPHKLESAGRLENLYTGNLGQTLEDQTPYLLEFDPYQQETIAFLQRLFRQSENSVFSHWEINPVIFIKSQKNFDEVYRHLRKWTHLYDPNTDKWYFFRFYDPLVLNRYLPQLSHYPAQLAALFGAKTQTTEAYDNPQEQEQIIEAFGLRVENEFISFKLNPLPKNTLPAKIELGEIEKKVMKLLAWTQFKIKLIKTITKLYPNKSSQSHWSVWLDEIKDNNLLTSERSYFYYLNGRIIAEKKQQNYWTAWEKIQSKETLSELDLVKKLMESLNDTYR